MSSISKIAGPLPKTLLMKGILHSNFSRSLLTPKKCMFWEIPLNDSSHLPKTYMEKNHMQEKTELWRKI